MPATGEQRSRGSLAGSAAYAIDEARGWPVGLAQRPQQAKAFYSTIAIATLLAALGNVLAISPLEALVWAAVDVPPLSVA
jgi:hypothetical protein